MIECRNLTFGYKKALFPPVTLSMSSQRLVLLIGENGVGKSTFLKTLAGLIPPVSGEVLLGEKSVHAMNEQQRASVLAFVHSRPEFVPPLTAHEVIALASPGDDDAGVVTVAHRLHIEHLLEVPLNKMSDGERQKVMLARALAQDTPMILMDEPTAFLDHPSKRKWWKELLQLTEEGKTVVLSTHDLSFIPHEHPLVEALCFHPHHHTIEHKPRVSEHVLEAFFNA